MRENRTHGSTGGRWQRRVISRGPLVPGRCAEKRHHDGPVGTSTVTNSSAPAPYLTDWALGASDRRGVSVGWASRRLLCLRWGAAELVFVRVWVVGAE